MLVIGYIVHANGEVSKVYEEDSQRKDKNLDAVELGGDASKKLILYANRFTSAESNSAV